MTRKNFTIFLMALLVVLGGGSVWGQTTTYALVPNSTNTGLNNTSYITTETGFTYSGITWKMNQWNPSTLQVKTNQSLSNSEFYFYNNSAIPGNISQVVLTFSALTLSNTSNSGWYLSTGNSVVGMSNLSTEGSVEGIWSGAEKTLTFLVSGDATYFTIWQNGKVATGTNKLAEENSIVVTYTTSGGPTTYTVTYNANGATSGSVPTDENDYSNGDQVSVLGNTGHLKKINYTFMGWNTAADGSGDTYSTGSTFNITENTILYALWQLRDDLIMLDFESATNDNWTLGQNFTRTNNQYHNGSYSASINVKNAQYIECTQAINNICAVEFYVARFTNNTTSSIFKIQKKSLEGGAQWIDVEEFDVGSFNQNTWHECSYQFSTPFNGYIRLEYSSGTTAIRYIDDIVISVAEPSYTITYNANGGEGTMTDENSPYEAGATVTVLGNAFTKDCHTFSKWNTAANGSGIDYNPGATFTINENTTLYAQWTQNVYTITYYPGEGTGDEYSDDDVVCGSDYEFWDVDDVEFTAPSTKPNFVGWATSASGEAEYSPGDTYTVNDDLDLYAVWSENTVYTVSFNCDGADSSCPNEMTVAAGTTIQLPAAPVKAHYTFGGWWCDADDETYNAGADYEVNDGVEFLAQWTANNKTLTLVPCFGLASYDGDDFDAPKSITVLEGNTITLPDANNTICEIDGWVFVGWSTSPVATTQTVPSLLNGEYIVNENATLYAVYRKGEVKDTFMLSLVNDGTTYYVGERSSGNAYLESQTDVAYAAEMGIEINDSKSYLYYMDGTTKTYVSNKSKNSANLSFSDKLSEAQEWTLTQSNGTLVLQSTAETTSARYLGMNNNNVDPRFGAYVSSYPHQFTKISLSEAVFASFPDVDDNGTHTISSLEIPSAGGIVVTIKNSSSLTVTGTLTNTNPANLIIEEGGQLVVNNAGVQATVNKDFSQHGNFDSKADVPGWYLISSPVVSQPVSAFVSNAGTDDYDLYRWVGNNVVDGRLLPWYNQKAHTADEFGTNFEKGLGYLAAYENTNGFSFVGELNHGDSHDYTDQLTYRAENVWECYALLGNPYSYAIDWADFQKSGVYDGIAIVNPATGAYSYLTGLAMINPMQGFFVFATDVDPQLTYQKGSRQRAYIKQLNLSVAGKDGKDNVIIRLVDNDKGGFVKMDNFSAENPMLWLPVGGKAYAIASYSDNVGMVPLSFKAGKTGTYTLSVNAKEMEANYLHLVDNMTGTDIDLLTTPSYTFEARPTDYTSRFRIVFNAETAVNEGENFAYISNGNLVVENMGQATLQIVDVMGRVLRNENINGSYEMALNLKAGVYLVSLQGTDGVLTQKLVVE